MLWVLKCHCALFTCDFVQRGRSASDSDSFDIDTDALLLVWVKSSTLSLQHTLKTFRFKCDTCLEVVSKNVPLSLISVPPQM